MSFPLRDSQSGYGGLLGGCSNARLGMAVASAPASRRWRVDRLEAAFVCYCDVVVVVPRVANRVTPGSFVRQWVGDAIVVLTTVFLERTSTLLWWCHWLRPWGRTNDALMVGLEVPAIS